MAENLKAIAAFINSVGFPAAVAMILLYQVQRMHRSNTDILKLIVKQLQIYNRSNGHDLGQRDETKER